MRQPARQVVQKTAPHPVSRTSPGLAQATVVRSALDVHDEWRLNRTGASTWQQAVEQARELGS